MSFPKYVFRAFVIFSFISCSVPDDLNDSGFDEADSIDTVINDLETISTTTP